MVLSRSMILKIYTYPDPILRKKSEPVSEVTSEYRKLAEDMLETMYHARGIGLAAPQVGQHIRMLVIDTRSRDEKGQFTDEDLTDLEKKVAQPIVIFNPEIKVTKGKTTFEEGCLSLPSYFETVTRALEIEATGLDINGKTLKIHTDGLLAVCLQHEMDHLEGKLFIDRVSLIKANRIKNKIKKFGYPDPNKTEEAEEDEDSPSHHF